VREREGNKDDKCFIVSIDTSKTDQRSMSTFCLKLMVLSFLFNYDEKKTAGCSVLFITQKDYIQEKREKKTKVHV
jgi:hypothetical protein